MRPETSNHVIFGMTELGRVIRKKLGDERKSKEEEGGKREKMGQMQG